MTDKNPVDLDHLDALRDRWLSGQESCPYPGMLVHTYPAMAEELRRLRALFVLVANCALQMELALEDDLPFKAESFRDELKALLVDHAPQETLSQVQKDMRWQTWQTVYKATKVEALQYENDRLRARVAELEGK